MGKKKTKRRNSLEINQRLAVVADIVLFLIHLGFLIFFVYMRAYWMILLNVGSIFVYACSFRISRENPGQFLYVAYLEIVIHMVAAVVCTGWNCGFQLYCFCLVPVIFYCDYLARKAGNRKIRPTLIASCIAALFFLLRIYTMCNNPIYIFNNPILDMKIYLVNSVMILAFVIFYMANYEQLTMFTEAELKDSAATDELTKIYNRRIMQDAMQKAFLACEAGADQMAVCILDIDDFKLVNDGFGHNAGDFILREIAHDIRRTEDEHTIACRWGGEEFVLMSTGPDAYVILNNKMQNLIKKIAHTHFLFSQKGIPITLTGGIASYHGDESVEKLVSRADACLYYGKRNGKNQLICENEIK